MKTLFFTIFILLFSFGCASRSSMQETPQAQQTNDQKNMKRELGSVQQQNTEQSLIQGLREKYGVVGEPRKEFSNYQTYYRFNNAICRVQDHADAAYVLRSSLCYQLLREGTSFLETYQLSQDQQVKQTLITIFQRGGARGNPIIRVDENYRNMYFEFTNKVCTVSLGGIGRPIGLVDVDANLLNNIASQQYGGQRNCDKKQ